MAEVDKNWNAIRAAHGIVAVDHQWAAANGLPPADSLPSDNNKGVYTISAYHSLHCLVSGTAFDIWSRSITDPISRS